MWLSRFFFKKPDLVQKSVKSHSPNSVAVWAILVPTLCIPFSVTWTPVKAISLWTIGCENALSFPPPKSWEFMKLWQSMLGQFFGYISCNIVKYLYGLPRRFLFCYFCLTVSFILSNVTSNISFFRFCIITVHDCVLWHECCQNGHWWHCEACSFVSLPEK